MALNGRAGQKILAGPAADAAFFVHGGDARRLGVVGVPAPILIAPGRVMARTVVAADAVGVDLAILQSTRHGRSGSTISGEVGQADGARGAHLGALRALRTAVSALERHFGLHEGHQLARRTQHLIGTHRNTQLASRAMGVEVPQALRSGGTTGVARFGIFLSTITSPPSTFFSCCPGRR